MLTIMRRFSVKVQQSAADEYDLRPDEEYQVLAIKEVSGQTEILIAADDEFLWLDMEQCYIGSVE